ncbi:MAG: twin-arginine translocase subunit TatC [Solirubrobacteraceae bacterium]|nr:twin-arginine translocase subunit TatC [Solirubrobacteraceae bacterium]
MATTLRPISHEDQLSLVDHLDELRTRLVVCIVALSVCFGFCFWQVDAILDILNRPIETTQRLDRNGKSKDPLEQTARFQRELGQQLRSLEPVLDTSAASALALSASSDIPAAERRQLRQLTRELLAAQKQTAQAALATPTNIARKPVTLGVAEPFTSTITVAFYAALLLALPIILYQLFAFILPAFTPRERTLAIPLMFMGPVLFAAGVTFGYFVVLQRAVEFLQNFNDDNFDILVQAKDYYRFSVLFLMAIGLMFQIPLVVLAITRLGILTPKQLRKHRGYVLLAVALLAAIATPTPDPVTMLLAMAPLVVLFELSILLAAWLDRIRPLDADDEDPEPDDDAEPGDPSHAL